MAMRFTLSLLATSFLLFPSTVLAKQTTAAEWKALSHTRTILVAEMQFRILKKKIVHRKPVFGDFNDLKREQMLDSSWDTARFQNTPHYGRRAVNHGYQFELTFSKQATRFRCTARPLKSTKGKRRFYIDQSGTVTYTDDGSTPHGKSSSTGRLRPPSPQPKRVMNRFEKSWQVLRKDGLKRARRELKQVERQFERTVDRQIWRVERQIRRARQMVDQTRRQLERETKRTTEEISRRLNRFAENLPPSVRRMLPGYRQAQNLKKKATEKAVAASLRIIYSSQQMFRLTRKRMVGGKPMYGTLSDLAKVGMIDKALGRGKKFGYQFDLTLKKKGARYHIVARPLSGKGQKTFYLDNSGAITYTEDGSTPGPKSKKYSHR